MIESAKMIGFVPIKKYPEARAFYEGKLGCTLISEDVYAQVYRCGENMLRLVQTEHTKPLHGTVLGWEVQDIEEAVDWLVSRGIETEKFDFAQDRERGIWTSFHGKVAWFKDPDGNILSVSEFFTTLA